MSRGIIAWCAILLLGLIQRPAPGATGNELIVHEWGTFTSLQDESGNAVAGINADDEPVPGFVHTLGGRQVMDARAGLDRTSLKWAKSIPASHPDVTMRLETPVVYFHLPEGAGPTPVEVSVKFRGGWLSEFYPFASADVDGSPYDPKKKFTIGRIMGSTLGSLSWSKLMVGTDGVGPKTDQHVWLAPREVPAAANVTTTPATAERKSESEKFLFYRGIGHLDSPLRVMRDGETLHFDAGRVTGPVWFVDIRADGRCAFRAIDMTRPSSPAAFAEGDYRADTKDLRDAMRAALIADGLFADEADAMLNTWEVSYFKNPGTRVFFMVPREWTDRVLPLSVKTAGGSVPRERIVRTMVGRVELVTPAHRELLKVVANPPSKEAQLQAYKQLGRFRDALVIAEHARKPTDALAKLRQEQLIGQHELSKKSDLQILSGG